MPAGNPPSSRPCLVPVWLFAFMIAIARIGGMNHILLPGKADLKHFDNVTRYAINAMELLINRVMTLGGERASLGSKGFWRGACSSGCLSREWDGRQELRVRPGVPANGDDLRRQPGSGGHDTRKIYFHTDSGEVFLKRIPSTRYPNISIEERRLVELARRKAEESGDVDLFG